MSPAETTPDSINEPQTFAYPSTTPSSINEAGGGAVASYTGQLATGCYPPNGTTTLGATNQLMIRSRHIARSAITSAAIVIPTYYYKQPSGPIETALGGAATVTASFEYPVGTFTQILFGGSATGALADNANNVSDQAAVTIPKNAVFFVRMFWQSASGMLLEGPANDLGSPANNEGRDVVNGEFVHWAASGVTDMTMGGAIPNTVSPTGTTGFRPVAIIGPTTQPTFYIMGDSRARGFTDRYTDASTAIGIARMIVPYYGCINGACTGMRASSWLAGMPHQQQLAGYCSHIYCALGINDLSNATTSAALITLLKNIWTTYGTTRVVQATLPPETTTTDGWSSTANQTVAAWDAQRVAFNAAVRAGITGTIGFVEIADVAETARDSGKWRSDTVTAVYTATQAAKVLTVSAMTSGAIAIGDTTGYSGVVVRKWIVSGAGPYTVSSTQTVGTGTLMVDNAMTQDGVHEVPTAYALYVASGNFNPANYHYP